MYRSRLLHAVRDTRQGAAQTDFGHGIFELHTVFGFVDGLRRRTDQLYTVFVQNAMTMQIQRTVQCGLTAHGWQNRIRFFLFDDFFHHFPSDRLDIGRIRHLRVGHDRRRIGVHQNHAITLFAQGFTRLRTRVVKLTRLSDDDRPRADDQDAF